MDPGLSHCPWTCLCILIFPLTKLACWGLFRGEECTSNPNLSTGMPCNAQVKSGQRAGQDVAIPTPAGRPLASVWATPVQPSLRPGRRPGGLPTGALPWAWRSHPDPTGAPSSEAVLTHTVPCRLVPVPKPGTLGGGVFGKCFDPEGGAPIHGLRALTKGPPEPQSPSRPVRTQRDRGTHPCWHPGLWHPETSSLLNREKLVSTVSKFPSPWGPVTAAGRG